MKSYSWAEMDKWSKTKLIERIRALEHELSRPVVFRQKIDGGCVIPSCEFGTTICMICGKSVEDHFKKNESK